MLCEMFSIKTNTQHDKRIGRAGPFAWPARSSDLSPLGFWLLERLETTAYKLQLKMNRHFTKAFLTPPNHSQPPWDGHLKKSDSRMSHWFRWRTFWTFVVNCDLINNNSLTFITLGTCIVSVVQYYMFKVFSVVSNLPSRLKNHLFPNMFIRNFLCFGVINPLLQSFQTF